MPGRNHGCWKEGKFMAKKTNIAIETIQKLARANKQCKR